MDSAGMIAAAGVAMAVVGGLALATPRALRSCGALPFLVLALGAAAIGITAPGAPLRIPLADAALRATICVLFVYAAASVRPSVRVVAAAVVAVPAAFGPAGIGSIVAGFALGAALAVMAVGIDGPLVAGGIGLAVSQAALRLQWPRASGSSSVVAFAALAVLALPAIGALAPRARRHLTLAAGALAAAAIAATAAYGAVALSARADVDRGVAASRAALAASKRGDTIDAAREFRVAGASFGRAHTRLDSWFARPASVVPITAQYERALRTLTDTGADLALEGENLIRAADPAATLRHGRVAISEIRSLARPLATATRDLDRAQAQLDHIDTTWLVPPLSDKVHELQDRVTRARREAATGIDAARVLPALFGAGARRNYFVAFQTPSEERANGGIIGNFAVVSFTNGAFDLVRSGRDTDLNTGGSPNRTLAGPADYVRRYARFDPAATWQNVTMSPDFPSVGRVIEGLYPQSGGTAVDGVISVDPYAVAAILKLTGPVHVRGLPFALDAENAAQFLLRDQYTTFASNGLRIDFLGEAIDAVIHRLKTADLPNISAIAAALGPVVREGRLKLHSTRTGEQQFFERIGAAGALPDPAGDFTALTTQNASGNKIDIFEHRSTRYDVTVDPTSGQATAIATITLRNDAPATGLPPLVIDGSGPEPTPAGTSRVYLSLYSPLALQHASLGGAHISLDTSTELGRNVFSAFVLIPARSSVTLRVELAGRLPLRRVHGGWEYDLSFWHQPTIGPDAVSVTVHSANGFSIHPKHALRARDGAVSGGGSLSASETFAATVKTR